MKLLILVFSLVFYSAVTFACGNLTGEYTCTTTEVDGGAPTLTLVDHTQDHYSETVVSSFDNSETTTTFKIDGRYHFGAFGIRYKVICHEDKNMMIKLRGPLFLNSAKVRFVPTETGFIKYRKASGEKEKEFQVCNLR